MYLLKVKGMWKDFLTLIFIFQLDADLFLFFYDMVEDCSVLQCYHYVNLILLFHQRVRWLEYYHNLVYLQWIYYKDLETDNILGGLLLGFGSEERVRYLVWK